MAIVASMFGDFYYFQLITVDTINFPLFPLIFIISINYPLFPLIFEFFNSFFNFSPFSRKIYKKIIVRKTGDKFRIFSINVTLSSLNYEIFKEQL